MTRERGMEERLELGEGDVGAEGKGLAYESAPQLIEGEGVEGSVWEEDERALRRGLRGGDIDLKAVTFQVTFNNFHVVGDVCGEAGGKMEGGALGGDHRDSMAREGSDGQASNVRINKGKFQACASNGDLGIDHADRVPVV